MSVPPITPTEPTLKVAYGSTENYDLCVINGSKFALFFKPIHSPNTLSIDLSGHSIILISPIEAENDITIKAVNVIAFRNQIKTNGKLNIKASGKIISLGVYLLSAHGQSLVAEEDVYQRSINKDKADATEVSFREGIDNDDPELIWKGLQQIFSIITDPEDEEEEIELTEALKFYGIPTIQEEPN